MPIDEFSLASVNQAFFKNYRAKTLTALMGILHILLALLVYLCGRWNLLPGVFDRNGIGLAHALDSVAYLNEASTLVHLLKQEGFYHWLSNSSQFHVKLYSLTFLIFGPIFGENILSAEPLNVLYYLSTLILVYLIGREAFNKTAGLIAALLVGLWPSYLLHTVQLLKDPFFIAAMLSLILVGVSFLKRTYTWLQGLLAGTLGGAAVAALWLGRSMMWEVALIAVMMMIFLLVIRQIRERRILTGNPGGVILLLLLTYGAPPVLSIFQRPYPYFTTTENNAAAQPSLTSIAEKIISRRQWYVINYANQGSNIDTDVEINSPGEIVRYLPRAFLIGCCSPFPKLWSTIGRQVGRLGRMLSGFETLSMYAMQILALYYLWRTRGQRLSACLLLIVAVAGTTALGMVVINVGALYRMRYVFWILLIVIGAEGARLTPFFAQLRNRFLFNRQF